MRKGIYNKKILCILFVILLCAFTLTACTVSMPKNNKQLELENVVWSSEDNSFDVEIELLGLPYSRAIYGYVKYGDEKKEILLSWSDLHFRIDFVDYYGKTLSFINNNTPQYSQGSYKIIRDNKVELWFSQDYLFDGKLYDKKIVIAANEINPADYSIGLHHGVCWESGGGNLTLYTHQQMRRFSVGQYKNGESSKDVVIYWLDDNTFSAYELKDGVQEQEELLSGKYDYDGQTLTLNFSKNAICQSDSIEMTAREINYWEHPQEMWYPNIEE